MLTPGRLVRIQLGCREGWVLLPLALGVAHLSESHCTCSWEAQSEGQKQPCLETPQFDGRDEKHWMPREPAPPSEIGHNGQPARAWRSRALPRAGLKVATQFFK